MAALMTAIVAFIGQAGAGVWYASQFDARLHSLELKADGATEEFRKLEEAREASLIGQQKINDKLDAIYLQVGGAKRGGG